MIRFLIQVILLVVVFIAAWRVGGKPEKYVASIYFGTLVAWSVNAIFGGTTSDGDYEELHLFRFLLDVCTLFGVVFIALRYDRWWTLWVGSAQLLAVMAHLLRALDMPIAPLAYAVMERWPVWIAVALTGLGTLLHQRRTREIATDT